jgi:ribosomal protein L10
LGKISWIRQELKMFEQLEMINIEGVLCNELANIKRDIMGNEAKLKILRLTVLHGNNRK